MEIDKNQVNIELAKRKLIHFAKHTKKDYITNHHNIKLANKLDDLVSGKITKLVVSMPPRHGKSELVSRRLPAYALGVNPDISIIAASYGADLASRMNRDVQRIIESPHYKQVFPQTLLSSKNIKSNSNVSYLRNSDIFEIVDHKGGYRSAGVGGGITGMGADLAIIDDPIKDMAEAQSKRIRDNIWDWYTSTLSTRLEKGGKILVTMTRWHTDDLVGRILERDKEFDSLVMPAIQDDGTALWPDKYPIETLKKIKKNIGTRVFQSLYQQTPVLGSGGIIKREWFKYYDKSILNSAYTYFMSWDMSFKGGPNSDFVVGQLWARSGADRYLVDQVRGRWSFTATLDEFVSFTKKHPQATRKLVEAKANGEAIIDTLKKHIQGIIPVNPRDSKESRLNAVAPLIEAGNVHLPMGEHFIDDLVEECIGFPFVKNDDQVDTMTQALLDSKKEAKFAFVSSKSGIPRRF